MNFKLAAFILKREWQAASNHLDSPDGENDASQVVFVNGNGDKYWPIHVAFISNLNVLPDLLQELVDKNDATGLVKRDEHRDLFLAKLVLLYPPALSFPLPDTGNLLCLEAMKETCAPDLIKRMLTINTNLLMKSAFSP